MPIVQPDFSEAIDLSVIDEGTYESKMSVIKPMTSKKGDPMLECTCVMQVHGKPRERLTWMLTQGKGSGTFQQFLRAIGREDLAAGNVAFDTDELVGLDFMAIVTHQTEGTYAGRDQITGFLKA